ncbi:sensor histidine kinase [Streptomyces shenzhenensis]|uniref:sensor histidine kinase n=1 Tax=Streptomyces shenzhenensis TaxID=943815 RepID=UPI001F1B3CFE|nr:histidine kinase [Streptomyces shenzhenensis]
MRFSPRRVDAALAAVLLVWSLPDVPWWWRPPGHAAATPVVLGYLALALAQSVPFWWWRRVPPAVLGCATGAFLLRGALDRNQVAAGVAMLAAAYGVGAYGTRRRTAQLLGALSLAVAGGIGLFDFSHRMGGVPWVLLGAAFLVGDAATARRHEAATAAEAAHLAERSRIARELHDVLAHQLAAITVHAGTARLAPPEDPGKVFAAVEHLGREALTELSHLLGALRRDQETAPDRRPVPSLAELDALVDGIRATGTPVRYRTAGDVPGQLTPGLELSLFRICQEALTNATRHAPGAPVHLTVAYRPDRVEVTAVNGSAPAPRPSPGGGGRGLLGIRERVGLYGGHLHAGPTPGGGFRLFASVPCTDVLTKAAS